SGSELDLVAAGSPIALRGASDEPLLCQRSYIIEQGNVRHADTRHESRSTTHLQKMTEQPKTRHVRHSVYARDCGQLRARAIQARRGINQRLITLGGESLLPEGGGEYADAERLAEHQGISRMCLAVAFHAMRMHHPDGCQTVDRLDRVDAVPACNRNAGLRADDLATAEDLADRRERQRLDRHAENRECQNGRTAHRIDVRERVSRRNAAEIERIIDDRHE